MTVIYDKLWVHWIDFTCSLPVSGGFVEKFHVFICKSASIKCVLVLWLRVKNCVEVTESFFIKGDKDVALCSLVVVTYIIF